jgi:hypothetical protein
MFCSFKVELKDKADQPTDRGTITTFGSSKPRSDWEQVVDDATTSWVQDRPHTTTLRNVGGAPKNKWTPDEDRRLQTAVSRLGTENWQRIASFIPGRSGKQCRERWIAHLSPDVTRDDWSPEEDLILVRKQAEFGNHWAKIKAFLPGRSVVAAKNRWIWLCRRNVPKHTGEFEMIAELHAVVPPKPVKDLGLEEWSLFGSEIWGEHTFALDFEHPW